jgi:hypothetical protein
MTTPPGYAGNPIDTEGVSGNPGAASSGTQNQASNTETSTPAGQGYGGATVPAAPAATPPDTSGTNGTSSTYTPTSTLVSGTIDTRAVGWPSTPGVVQAYRAADLKVGYLDGTGARDTTWTDRPLSDGTTRPDIMTNYPGTVETGNIGAPTGTVGTGIPVAPSAPTLVAGNGSITVNWTAVADPSNAKVLGYVILSSTGGTAYAGRADRSYVFDTVVPNQAYTFKVAARNVNGLGPFSAASASASAYNAEETDATEPGGLWAANTANPVYKPDGTFVAGTGLAGIPNAPTSPTLTQGAAGILNATWVAPTTGGKLTSYTVTLSTGQTKSVAAGTLTAQFTGLTTGTATTVRVTAVGPLGSTQSVASASVNVP